MRLLKCLCVVLGCVLLSACLHRPYLAQNQYLLSTTCSSYRFNKAKPKGTVLLEKTAILPPYSSDNFIYRVSDISYLTDYYNVFLTPLSGQVYQTLNRCLTRARLFKEVVESSGFSRPNYWLDTKVLALYADYRNSVRPKAVLSMQFVLYHKNEDQSQPKKVFDKTYREVILLKHKDTVSLVNAWSVGLHRALRSSFSDMRMPILRLDARVNKPSVVPAQ